MISPLEIGDLRRVFRRRIRGLIAIARRRANCHSLAPNSVPQLSSIF